VWKNRLASLSILFTSLIRSTLILLSVLGHTSSSQRRSHLGADRANT